MLRVKLSAETIRLTSQHHGQAMARFQPTDTKAAQAFQDAKGQAEFTIDAGKVNTREDGWRDLKIGVFQKRLKALAVEPSGWQEQRLPQAQVRIAFARIATSKHFRRSWRGWLSRLGIAVPGELLVLADGASWIWKSVERVLSGSMQTLDVYHACEHLGAAAVRLYGEQTSQSQAAFERARELLISSGWNGVCRWLAEQLAVADTAESRKVVDGVIGYFSKHLKRLNYASGLAEGRAIGSGAVEGQAKTLGLRLKARGARWKRKNVRAMAALVCVRHSDQFGNYWANAA
jgi:hypothetical protein